MKKIVFVLVALFTFSSLFAQSMSVGKYSGEFLAIGVGGRALGMGSAFVALANDVTAGYWNPAGLSKVDYPQGILMHDERFSGLVNYNYGAIALPYKSDMTLGLSVIRLGVDGIPDTRNALIDLNGNLKLDNNELLDYSKITEFNAADWAFIFSLAKRYRENLSFGANLKIIKRDIAEFGAWGIGFDIGAVYSPITNLSLGANLQDITTTIVAWDNGTTQLISPTLKLGAAYQLKIFNGILTPAFDTDIRFENRRFASMLNLGPVSFDFHTGLEYTYDNLISIRFGYNDVKQLTFGAGIVLPKLNIDYSFVKFDRQGELGNTHRISLMLTLQETKYQRQLD
ncbi:MAG: PorV/PorQ family protein [Ignavibacterium sp.]|nr:PorV/PorQ family protein [Ignavibacterium sp.]